MDKPKRIRAQGNSGRCTKQSKRRYSKKRRNPNKWEKMTSWPLVVEEAIIEELVESNELLTNENNVIEPSTISTDKFELIELPKDSYPQDSDLLIYSSCQICFFIGVPKLLDKTYSEASRHWKQEKRTGMIYAN